MHVKIRKYNNAVSSGPDPPKCDTDEPSSFMTPKKPQSTPTEKVQAVRFEEPQKQHISNLQSDEKEDVNSVKETSEHRS